MATEAERPEAQRPEVPLREPWRVGGPLSLWRDRSLLWLLVRKARATRNRGTVLGMAWDFINPVVQFTVYFFVIGILLGLDRRVENFPLYIFSGLVTVQVFIGGMNSSATSFIRNRVLLRRVAMPRELVPASRVLNEFISLGPPMVILLLASAIYGFTQGWQPSAYAFGFALLGIVVLTAFTFGLGLLAAVANVFIRDTQQVVSVITTLARWAVPIIYPWTLVTERLGDGLLTTLYLANPVTIGVFGMREAFWHPTVETGLPPLPQASLVIGLFVTVAVVVLGLLVLNRYQDRIVQRLRWST